MDKNRIEGRHGASRWHNTPHKGAPGIDGMTVGAFPAFAREQWPRIARALMEGTYRPAPVKRVWIPKPDGSKRPLGVPTVLDRLIRRYLCAGVVLPDGTREATPQGAGRHRRTAPVCPRLAQLLQAQCHLHGRAGAFRVVEKTGEVVLLEAMEAAAHAPPSSTRLGGLPRESAFGVSQPQGLLADEPELACPPRVEQPLA